MNDEHNLTEEQQDFVHEITSAAIHLLDLINEVLDIARIESGKYEKNMQTVDLNGLSNKV